jgi:hypothetical protein
MNLLEFRCLLPTILIVACSPLQTLSTVITGKLEHEPKRYMRKGWITASESKEESMRKLISITVCFWMIPLLPASADDWLHWRGSNRNDTVSESSGWSKDRWLPRDPTWMKQVGEGSTSPIVVGNRVYVLGWRNKQDVLSCLDAKTGNELWSKSYDCPRYGRYATESRSDKPSGVG